MNPGSSLRAIPVAQRVAVCDAARPIAHASTADAPQAIRAPVTSITFCRRSRSPPDPPHSVHRTKHRLPLTLVVLKQFGKSKTNERNNVDGTGTESRTGCQQRGPEGGDADREQGGEGERDRRGHCRTCCGGKGGAQGDEGRRAHRLRRAQVGQDTEEAGAGRQRGRGPHPRQGMVSAFLRCLFFFFLLLSFRDRLFARPPAREQLAEKGGNCGRNCSRGRPDAFSQIVLSAICCGNCRVYGWIC